MKIIVFGANGPTGQIVCRRAVGAGHDVTAFTRHPDTFPGRESGDHEVRVAGGDVLDADAVDAAVAGQDVVISTLGVPFGKVPVDVYSVGVTNMLAAMARHGVTRLICVSSSTMAPHPEPQGGLVFRKVMQPYVVNVMGRTVYEDMHRMEDLVRQSAVDWTIVRPSGLFTLDTVTDYAVAEDHILGRFTSREDLADCLVRQASATTFVRKALAIATTAVRPSMVQLIWREGIRKK